MAENLEAPDTAEELKRLLTGVATAAAAGALVIGIAQWLGRQGRPPEPD
jgi:hypothetical protein